MKAAEFAKKYPTDPDWVAAMGDREITPLVPGQKGKYGEFDAVVREHYHNGMYNIRVPGGVTCVSGEEFVPSESPDKKPPLLMATFTSDSNESFHVVLHPFDHSVSLDQMPFGEEHIARVTLQLEAEGASQEISVSGYVWDEILGQSDDFEDFTAQASETTLRNAVAGGTGAMKGWLVVGDDGVLRTSRELIAAEGFRKAEAQAKPPPAVTSREAAAWQQLADSDLKGAPSSHRVVVVNGDLTHGFGVSVEKGEFKHRLNRLTPSLQGVSLMSIEDASTVRQALNTMGSDPHLGLYHAFDYQELAARMVGKANLEVHQASVAKDRANEIAAALQGLGWAVKPEQPGVLQKDFAAPYGVYLRREALPAPSGIGGSVVTYTAVVTVDGWPSLGAEKPSTIVGEDRQRSAVPFAKQLDEEAAAIVERRLTATVAFEFKDRVYSFEEMLVSSLDDPEVTAWLVKAEVDDAWDGDLRAVLPPQHALAADAEVDGRAQALQTGEALDQDPSGP